MSRTKKVPEPQQEQIHIAIFSLCSLRHFGPPNHVKIGYLPDWSALLTQIRTYIGSKVKRIISFQTSYVPSNSWPGEYSLVITVEYTGNVLPDDVGREINEVCK
jgi:hypothetical protein